MTKDEKLDEFLKRIGIELLPFQKEFIKKITDEDKIYMCYPPHVGRYESLRLMQALANVFEKGERNGRTDIEGSIAEASMKGEKDGQ